MTEPCEICKDRAQDRGLVLVRGRSLLLLMARADPHCHTLASDGMATPADLVSAAVEAGLDLIAVTDHDTMAAAHETQQRGEAAGVIVIAGEEVTTRGPALTHIIGWFLEKPIRRGMALDDTVKAIHDQGGLVIVPHPFMPVYFGSIQPGMLRRLIESHSVDGIEMLATVPLGARRRRLLNDFYTANRERLGSAIGSSDCHFGRHDIGQVVTTYEGDFRAAVLGGGTKPERGRSANVPAGMAARQQWRAIVDLPLRRLTGRL